MMSHLKWISSEGGPLVLLPSSLLSSWMGLYLPADEIHSAEVTTDRGDFYIPDDAIALGPTTDYGRACVIADHIALLPVGSGYGLVLDDDPNATAWWPLDHATGGLLVRWISAESEADIIHDLEQLPELEWHNELEWEIKDSELVLLDAGDLGFQPENDTLHIRLPRGRYKISTVEEYGLTEGTALTLHKLERIPHR